MLRKIAVLLLLGASLMTACGGGDEETPADAVDGGAAAETGAGGDVDVGPIDAARCAELAQAMAAAAAAVPQAAAGGASDLETTLQQLEAIAEAAPEEIADDLRVVAEGYARVVQAFEESGYDPASGQPPTADQLAAFTAAAEELDSEEFRAAVDRVNAYFETECGT